MSIRCSFIFNNICKHRLKIVSSYKNYSCFSSSKVFNKYSRVVYCGNVFKRDEGTVSAPVTDGTSQGSTFVSGGTLSDTIFFKLSGSEAVSYVQKMLVTVHDSTGLPWWGTIALTTLVLRSVITFPLGVYQAYISAKVENISLIDMPEIAKDVQERVRNKAIQHKWTSKQANREYKYQLKSEWDKLIVSQNCHPVKATLPIWFQIPTWICFSTALRNISYMLPNNDAEAQVKFMELSVGGLLWFPNLAVPDTTFILPILLGISNLIIIEIQCMMRMRETTKAQRIATNFFRFFSIVLVPISATVPSSVCLYWSVSSLLGLCQNLILMSNRVRSSLHIPDTPTTLDRPYTHLAHQIAVRLRITSAR